MFDHYNQALIQGSFGRLSLSPRVTVLPEVAVAKDPVVPGDDAIGYYTVPGTQALAAQPGPNPWMFLVLAPLARHQVPPYRAWSGGPTAGGAIITTCFAQFYYAVHETGHRIGFKHTNPYKLDSAVAAPADPLGPGVFVDNAYSDEMDVMSCCKGDYGLYHRTLAGWLRGSGRQLITAQEVQQAEAQERKLVLWPFDRSESKGQLLSLAVRRSNDEVLLVGFQAASHWQETGSVAPEDARQNVRGLQIEYTARQGGAWASSRALVDMNVVHGDWPDALPAAPQQFPR